MKVWLDDIREPWKHGHAGWEWAKSYEEAIAFLKTGEVKEIHLDHDLIYPDHYIAFDSEGNPGIKNDHSTGYHVILWMRDNNVWPEKVHVHTASSFGRNRMMEVLHRYFSHCYSPGYSDVFLYTFQNRRCET